VFANNLGIALERTGHYGAAAEAYKAALTADSSYGKAAASLARVEGRDDEPGVEPVTVAQLGDSFAQEVTQWSEQRVSEIAAPSVDSVSVKEDSVRGVTTVSKTDSTMY
jgi:hypothetical protein